MLIISPILRKQALISKRQQASSILQPLRRWNHTNTSAAVTTTTDIVPDDPIHRVDLRVGKIVDIKDHPEAKHLFIEQVDLNSESTENMPNPRTIVSGLAPFMQKESLLNKLVVVVSNLKPSRFRGVLSQGMLLATSSKDGKVVRLLSPPEGTKVGERLALEGVEWQGEVDPVLRPKQKVFESVAPFLKTNEQGIATYKNIKLMTEKGPIICEIKDGQIS